MQTILDGYLISDDKKLIQLDRVCELLSCTYWAKSRTKDTITASIENSLCFGLYKYDVQIGFARCITDYSVMYLLCDVIIDENHRGQGLGKSLIQFITEHELLKNLTGILRTKDAHGLYMQYHFVNDNGIAMYRKPRLTE